MLAHGSSWLVKCLSLKVWVCSLLQNLNDHLSNPGNNLWALSATLAN